MTTGQLPVPNPPALPATSRSIRTSAANRSQSHWARGASAKVGRKLLGTYLSNSKRIWNHLPSWTPKAFHRLYGRHLHAIARLQADRRQYFATFFLRNRPELELMRRLVSRSGPQMKLTVLACSKGAEVYSIAWTLRSAFPDIDLSISAIDISQEIVEFAEKGVYVFADPNSQSSGARELPVRRDWNTGRDQNAWIFERVTKDELEAMFTIQGESAEIKQYLKGGIAWSCGDAGDPELADRLGPQDIVVANRFLCHMSPADAAACLRNIAKTVKPGGYLFVSGIDLDVRTQVAIEMGWQPVPELLKEIHDGDDSIRRGWPVEYWGVEPLDDTRPDWQVRYASVFKVGEKREVAVSVRRER